MNDLLLLTVGTGTAGRTSNLVAGLRRAIELTAPARFWLAPSTDEISLLTADEVRHGHEQTFVPWSARQPYHCIPDPDDLESCRIHLRDLIRAIRGGLRPGQRLIVNPTSGTKQMTAAAVLAALDEQIGDIAFIAGERADGVVKTGTERLTSFDPAALLRERDLSQARDAAQRGGFAAAERLLAPHRQILLKEHATADCLRHWQRQDYTAAAAAAARFDEALRAHLSRLADFSRDGFPHEEVISDLLAWSKRRLQLGDADAALILAHKTLELAARLRLFESTELLPPYPMDSVEAWPIRAGLLGKLSNMSRDRVVFFGLATAMQILQQMGDPMGIAFQTDSRYYYATQARNELTHGIAPVAPANAQRLLGLAGNLILQHVDLPPAWELPSL